jgi:hypothetical protein
MTMLGWVLSVTLGILYIALIFTVAILTFRKGYTFLGIVGFIFPILWLIGAVLPPKKGTRFWEEEMARYQEEMDLMTR